MKRLVSLLLICTIIIMAVWGYIENSGNEHGDEAKEQQWNTAATTPYGKYPEKVTYTLGKQIGANNSNMPEGDTYENNAYTRYLLEKLNIQNVNVFEEMDDQYNTEVSMAIAMEDIPDIMVINSHEDLVDLVNKGLVEDLTQSYENCASDAIKEIYNSYGEDIFDGVTFDGKLMAIPETNIAEGPNLIWLRKDWMDELELEAPKTLEDVEYIVSKFLEADSSRVGIATYSALCGESGYSSQYLTDIIFATFGAYPKQWIENSDGEVVYGSVQPEAKEALIHLHELYEKGILDRNFLFRSTNDIIELIVSGKCGSFFGPWWSPNNPLMAATEQSEDADWQPYLIATNADGNTYYHSTNPTSYKYVVVRKGFEHPEIAWKIISVLFDYARYEDKEGAAEIAEYDKNAVDPTARPLVINVDYNDALSRCYENIQSVLSGEKHISELNELERSYAEQCVAYLENEDNATLGQWAAYVSRVEACSLIADDKVKVVKSLFFSATPTMNTCWWQLKELEDETYLKIITGKVDIDYFDEFVEKWNQQGGKVITKEIRAILMK